MRSEAHIRLARWAIWLIPLLWAVNYFIARRAPGVVEPYTLACMRWGLAGLLLSIHARAELACAWRQIARVWYQYLVLGFCGMVVCGAWVYLGAKSTGAVNISLIYSASPVLITIASVIWLHERMRWSQVLGVLLALCGVLHVLVKGQWSALAQVQFVVGDLWIVAAMVAWALYALLQKLWPSSMGASARLAAICWGAMPVLLAGTAWELAQPGTPPLSAHAWGLGVFAALVPGVMAYWIYGWAQHMLGASKVAVTLYLGPLYGALLAWLVLGESLGWHHVLAAMLILPGVYLVSRAGAGKAAPA
jgi:drug/metabolite transporter (DMT)-like permease